MTNFKLLDTPIEFLKGVGPQRGELLKKELNIHTFKDLMYHFPYRYVDRSVIHALREVPELDGYGQFRGVLVGVKEMGTGRAKRLIARFQDPTGAIDLIWFQGFQWIKPNLVLNTPFQIYGKPKLVGSFWNIPHPEMTLLSELSDELQRGQQPLYSSTEKCTAKGLHARGIEKLIQTLLPQLPNDLPDFIPAYVCQELSLMSHREALFQIHQPADERTAHKARYRMKFEELLVLQLEILLKREQAKRDEKGFVFEEVGMPFLKFYNELLPFPLTNAQKRVIKEIRKDFLTGHHMNRLLQGDVGSGKTVVSLLTMLIAVGNGFQAALMAPTEILAAQHFSSLKEMVKDLDIRIELLTGSVKKKNRTHIHEGLRSGEVHILVGTHALLEDEVQFKNVGVVVIDEQHRFGVAQRGRMWKKNTLPPHILVMTATPIPRTLAMTIYGDLEVSVIEELPPGRKPITTIHKFENYRLRLNQFIHSEIALGRQVYVVYPLIEESKNMDYLNLMSGFESLTRAFPLPEYRISIVNGKQKPEVKDFEMQRFIKGETQIMVATTVIEVGVNVPNASVMIIESAERFGLSQLHQLRGRVGRGAEKSYCILMTGDKLSKEAKKRMQTMVQTNDGFEIAEVDMMLRGPGDIMGTQQSGILDLKIASLSKDADIVTTAREWATQIIERDPRLTLPEHQLLRERMIKQFKSKPNWAKVS